MSRFRTSATCALILALAAVVLVAPSAGAIEIETQFPFELDKWYDLDLTDGPVTLRRVRVKLQESNLKSRLMRPSNSEFAETVQIQVEYINKSSKEYEAEIDIVWVDADGKEIDGYRGEEGIDEDEKDEMTMTFSTLRYGLDAAKILRVKIEF